MKSTGNNENQTRFLERILKNPAAPVVSALIAGSLLLFFLLRGKDSNTDRNQFGKSSVAAMAAEDDPLQLGETESDFVYICPMNCVPPMQKPGQCPICGMDLVPSAEHRHEGPEDEFSSLQIPKSALVSAGVRTAPVRRKIVAAEIRLYGKIEYDPVEQYKVSAFAPGVIDRIYVKRAGQTVRRGDPLFDLNSAELFFLEQELFRELAKFPDDVDYRPSRGQRYKRLMRPARRTIVVETDEQGRQDEEQKKALEKIEQIKRKMRLLGLSKDDIDNLMAKGRPTGITTVTTPTTGVVLEQLAFKGNFVNTGDTIFTVANPRFMWAKLDAYESDYAWLRLGQKAEFQTDSFPGQTFEGKVLYLDPFFDPATRTFKVGVLYTDPKAQLKPNMLVRCIIEAPITDSGVGMPGKTSDGNAPLVIPESAPLITGMRAIVYVESAESPGIFEARKVVLGPRAEGLYVVEEGLKEGEMVAVNGNFKIDSAVQILAKHSMMHDKEGGTIAGHQHMGMPLPMERQTDLLKEGESKGPQHRIYGGPHNPANPRELKND